MYFRMPVVHAGLSQPQGHWKVRTSRKPATLSLCLNKTWWTVPLNMVRLSHGCYSYNLTTSGKALHEGKRGLTSHHHFLFWHPPSLSLYIFGLTVTHCFLLPSRLIKLFTIRFIKNNHHFLVM